MAPAGLLSAWWLGPKLAGSPGAPQSALSLPPAAPQLVATRASAAVWPGADAAEVESVALGRSCAAAERPAVDAPPSGQAELPPAASELATVRSSAVAWPGTDAAGMGTVVPGSNGAAAERPVDALPDGGVAGAAQNGAPGPRDAALDTVSESRCASRQSTAAGAAGQAGSAELSAASAERPDRVRALPEDDWELGAAGVCGEAELLAAGCNSVGDEDACCEPLVGQDAPLLSTSSCGRVSGCNEDGAAAPITVRDIVSEWLVNGHEVVTVRQNSARAQALAHSLVHAVAGDNGSRR